MKKLMDTPKELYFKNTKNFIISFTISFALSLISIINENTQNSIITNIGDTFGAIGELLALLILVSFGMMFSLFGAFIYQSIIWFYIGQLFGFFINGFLIFSVIKLFHLCLKRK